VSDILLTDGVAGTEAVDRSDRRGALVYERMLLASPGSVARMRHELSAVLARQQVRADRLADIDLVFIEAAHNAVDHAYRRVGPGPLYTAASLAGATVIIWVSDGGRGMYCGSSRGAGLGMPLMTELADDLHISCDAVLGGTCVQATFRRAAYPAGRAAVSCEPEHAELDRNTYACSGRSPPRCVTTRKPYSPRPPRQSRRRGSDSSSAACGPALGTPRRDRRPS
jgi:anti-sigma regulatory factor (Ser/Thr protein kinase)